MAEVLIITGLVVALFYIFFIRPARTEQSRRQRDLNDLRIGDEVLTVGGLIATVVAVETSAIGPLVLHLELADDVVVRAKTEAIAYRLQTAAEASDLNDPDFDDLDDAKWDDADEEDVDEDDADLPDAMRGSGGITERR